MYKCTQTSRHTHLHIHRAQKNKQSFCEYITTTKSKILALYLRILGIEMAKLHPEYDSSLKIIERSGHVCSCVCMLVWVCVCVCVFGPRDRDNGFANVRKAFYYWAVFLFQVNVLQI